MKASLKRLALPIGIGAFAIVLILIGVIYFMQSQEHARYRSEIDDLRINLSRPFEPREGLREQYLEVLDNIPLVFEMPVTGAYTEVEFREMVSGYIVALANDTVSYPSIDTSSVGNLSIKPGEPTKNVTVGANKKYNVYPFEITIAKIGYDEIMRFAADLESMPELQTLVIEGFDVKTTAETGQARIDIGIYTSSS
jgi:hypothetical protein